MTEAEYLEEAFEQPARKAKKAKKDKAYEATSLKYQLFRKRLKILKLTRSYLKEPEVVRLVLLLSLLLNNLLFQRGRESTLLGS